MAHARHRIIRRIVNRISVQQGKFQTAILALFFLVAREIVCTGIRFVCIREFEDERAGGGVVGGNVEVEDGGVFVGDGGAILVAEGEVGGGGGDGDDEVGELEGAAADVGGAGGVGG